MQTLFSAIANSGDWAGSDTIPDDFYKELKVRQFLSLGKQCTYSGTFAGIEEIRYPEYFGL